MQTDSLAVFTFNALMHNSNGEPFTPPETFEVEEPKDEDLDIDILYKQKFKPPSPSIRVPEGEQVHTSLPEVTCLYYCI
jgi:hypothetical protein